MIQRISYWFSFILVSFLFIASSFAQDSTVIYRFDIKEEIAPPIWRTTKLAMEEANELKVDAIIIDMDTYGGQVDMADSIRTKILRSKIPVFVVINNNAASAGAFISLACDSIYMHPGSTIGAATVVNQSGEAVPDKYQSYMRSKMRATAEQNGRNPDIAEAMVDPDKYVPGISDSGKVLTFTSTEAMQHGYCEGEVNSVEEALKKAGYDNYELISHKQTSVDKIIGYLINPAISGVLILVIIGGIYYELQSPGIGFPIIASLIAAVVFFAPYYLQGLTDNWEIIVFVIGLLLVALEVFVIPGFGIAGISGILFIVVGLTLAMIDNVGFDFTWVSTTKIVVALTTVLVSVSTSVVGGIFFLPAIIKRSPIKGIVLEDEQDVSRGFVSSTSEYAELVGKTGVCYTDLRPSGKVEIDQELYDAASAEGFVEKGTPVEVIKYQGAQLFIRKIN